MVLNAGFDPKPRISALWRATYTLAALCVGVVTIFILTRSAPVSAGETADSSPDSPPEELPAELWEKPFSGRSGKVKDLLLRGNGTKESEAAVAAGLKWLVHHQAPDGHWSLDDFDKDGHCNCTGKATKGHDVAATAFGLLPLLGAGETHKGGGKYAKNVERALKFLLGKQKKDGSFTNFLYSHALATTAVCEAYAMTADPVLKTPAQKALDFIVGAQNANGGWGYQPGIRSDTSITGFQLTALKTGQMAGLSVPFKALRDVYYTWLDKCASPDGGGYGYVGPGETPTMSAVGLLCREYLGWGPRNPGLAAGINRLCNGVAGKPFPEKLPATSAKSMYFNYYATKLIYHRGGEAWEFWNSKMRDQLIFRQDKGDTKHPHQAGSWSPTGDTFGEQGGRIMITSLSILTLEVYYREAPLYRPFPIRRR